MSPSCFFPRRAVMASSCAQLCLRCRTLLRQKTLAVTWQCSFQFGDSPAFIRTCTRGIHTAAEARQGWKHQKFSHTELTPKHFSTEASEDKCKEKLTKIDVQYNDSLVPIIDNVPETQSQISLSKYWFSGIDDHINVIIHTGYNIV